MPRLGEEVEGRHRVEVVALLDDLFHVPCQGGGVAIVGWVANPPNNKNQIKLYHAGIQEGLS